MTFLITGAYGFVGTNLCRYLEGKGHVCWALDVPKARREDVPYQAFYNWDQLADLPACDVVVHLAGKAHDLKNVASEQSYFDVNVGLTEKILAAMKNKMGQFIYFSSSKADAHGNAYGRSKLEAERVVEKGFEVSGSKFEGKESLRFEVSSLRFGWVILRPAMIHGPGNKGNLNLLWGIVRRGLPWPLAAFENQRSFTSIGNVCAAVEALAEKRVSGRFFIADDEMLSTNRLVELIAEANGKKARLWWLPRGLMRAAAKIGDVLRLPLNTERIEKLTEDSFVDNAELKKALGWGKMPIRAEDGMRATLKAFRGEV